MSTIKSSAENLTLNADGGSSDVKFQINAVEKASINSAGKVALGGSTAVTSDSQVAIHGGNLELTTAGARYWIPRASDAALTGSLYSPSGSVVRLSGSGTSSGTIEFEPRSSNGVIARVTGDGLCFGSDTAAANALDDYEEGTYNITAVDSSGGATLTLKSYTNTLHYTKIGQLVHVQGKVQIDTLSGTCSGTLQINLPFTSHDGTDTSWATGAVNTQYVDWTTGTAPYCTVGESSANLQFYTCGDSAGTGLVQPPASRYVQFNIQYIAA
jgi:hypothetical protein